MGKGPKHDDLISQFTNMTGCDADQATFYLESTNWEIGAAIETYFDAGAGGTEDADMANIPPENVAAQSASFAGQFRGWTAAATDRVGKYRGCGAAARRQPVRESALEFSAHRHVQQHSQSGER